MSDEVPCTNSKNVLVPREESVPIAENVHVGCCRRQLTKKTIELMAIEKYRFSGHGITIKDITSKCSVKKSKAQRSLKYFHSTGVLFTAKDLIRQGIHLLQNKNPQEYFAVCMKAEILESLKKRKNVPVQPTGVNYSKHCLFPSRDPLFNTIEHQKAHTFLEVLVALAYTSPYMHKLLLMFHLDREFYNEMQQKEQRINRAKSHEELIGRRHVTYTLSPNGTVEVYIATNDTPLIIENDEDISDIFAFLGQVRDRFLYHVSDIKERHVPTLMNWILMQCDLNRDVEIDDMSQLTFPDIQLKFADRVFRLYVKIIKGKAYCRGEEALTLIQILPEALDNIRHPYRSLEGKIDTLAKRLALLIGETGNHD